jgi:transcription initiation factor TFIID subunit 9B
MASPQLQNGHPSTPPATDPANKPSDQAKPDPDAPLTSQQDDGLSKRPRDARLIHTVLQNLGVQSYQERVPLQLLDFAYRYTSSVLSDSLRLSAEGYTAQASEKRKAAAGDDGSNITVTALRQAIASRQGYAFESALPKEFMLEQAGERNRVALPKVERGYGVQLPEEKYCLTGVGWGLKEEWDSEEEEAPKVNGIANAAQPSASQEDETMGGVDGTGKEEEEEEGDDEGEGKMEDIFGEEGGGDGDDDVMKED